MDREIDELDNDKRGHFELTRQNMRDISEMQREVAGLTSEVESMSHAMGQSFSSLRDQISSLSSQILAQSQQKAPWPAIGGLILTIVIIFGSVFAWLFSNQGDQTYQAISTMHREIDNRFDGLSQRESDLRILLEGEKVRVQGVFNDIYDRFAVDDAREQKDLYDKGYAEAQFNDLQKELHHLDEKLHNRHDRDEDWKQEIQQRLSSAETAMRAIGEYIDEHTSKQGHWGE